MAANDVGSIRLYDDVAAASSSLAAVVTADVATTAASSASSSAAGAATAAATQDLDRPRRGTGRGTGSLRGIAIPPVSSRGEASPNDHDNIDSISISCVTHNGPAPAPHAATAAIANNADCEGNGDHGPPGAAQRHALAHNSTDHHQGASPAMIFSDFYKSPRSPLAKLRHHHPQLPSQSPTDTPHWVATEYADLLSKDKSKQKEAVKRYLSDKVKTDWQFTWPPQPHASSPIARDASVGQEDAASTTAEPDQSSDGARAPVQDETRDDAGYQVDEGSELEAPPSEDDQVDDDDDDAKSVYSIVSEDAVHYRPRMEWTSELSDDDVPTSSSHVRFDGNNSVQSAADSQLEKRARRRRALREEIEWNEGLACFEARRNAWTGARTVRVRSKPASPPATSPRSPRRFFFRHSMSGSPPSSIPSAAATSVEGSGTVSDTSSVARDTSDKELRKHRTQGSSVSDMATAKLYPVETLLPIGQPLLPPNNPLRASISPSVYMSLYEKVILNNLQPACPVNLSDMLRSCVAGWKRDGEWPPKPSAPDNIAVVRKKKKVQATGNDNSAKTTRRMSFGLLGRERDKEDDSRTGKGIRRSLQRALGFNVGSANHENGEKEKTNKV
ncbi:mitochondrial AAA ATPase [Purpureocillium lavendulum]|uniref:Mitochondrial AAA ATPase n=1 Tax=Purpureocillium lavendulum TaxID=1247861 RepID=A0AB34FQ59_9HYPO|nr:mitochondrial AAA ATPase [Purpureocillium lavendulum]